MWNVKKSHKMAALTNRILFRNGELWLLLIILQMSLHNVNCTLTSLLFPCVLACVFLCILHKTLTWHAVGYVRKTLNAVDMLHIDFRTQRNLTSSLYSY